MFLIRTEEVLACGFRKNKGRIFKQKKKGFKSVHILQMTWIFHDVSGVGRAFWACFITTHGWIRAWIGGGVVLFASPFRPRWKQARVHFPRRASEALNGSKARAEKGSRLGYLSAPSAKRLLTRRSLVPEIWNLRQISKLQLNWIMFLQRIKYSRSNFSV